MATETRRGAPVAHGERVLTPISRSFRVRLPGGAGGFIWSGPFGIEVEEGDRRRLLQVGDPTRKIQLWLLAAGLVAGLLLALSRSGRSRRRRTFRR